MITRRQLNARLTGSLLLPAIGSPWRAWAAELFEEDPLPAMTYGDGPEASLAEYFNALKEPPAASMPSKGNAPLGKSEPTLREQTLGDKIIFNAPYACTPLQVAEYFRPGNLSKQFGELAREYASGWAEGATKPRNPVVFEFLRHMKHIEKDEGDEYNWCASFMYWCLGRASATARSLTTEEIKKTDHHPGARTFICFGEPTETPKRGDIAVWIEKGKAIDCPFNEKQKYIGHVAFYLGETTIDGPNGTKVPALWVLGGNQATDATSDPPLVDGRNSWICIKKYPKTHVSRNKVIELAGFRTHPRLHNPPSRPVGSPAKQCTKEMQEKGEC